MLTVKQVAEKLEISEKTVLTLIKEHQLPAYQFGKRFKVEESDLETFIKTSKTIE